mmetsp:Transcript_7115/g.18452  ORF Transcript_7115/g.18452 Transcript_7115/m.18452 type:complete len:257 (-) Transcript_7115:1561-2331(-)
MTAHPPRGLDPIAELRTQDVIREIGIESDPEGFYLLVGPHGRLHLELFSNNLPQLVVRDIVGIRVIVNLLEDFQPCDTFMHVSGRVGDAPLLVLGRKLLELFTFRDRNAFCGHLILHVHGADGRHKHLVLDMLRMCLVEQRALALATETQKLLASLIGSHRLLPLHKTMHLGILDGSRVVLVEGNPERLQLCVRKLVGSDGQPFADARRELLQTDQARKVVVELLEKLEPARPGLLPKSLIEPLVELLGNLLDLLV